MFAQESVMDIQKEKIAHEKHLLSQGVDFKYLPNIQYSELENVYELIEWDEEYSEALNEINSSWCTWQAAKAQVVLEKDAIIQKLSDQLYAQEMKTSGARVLCETACELLDGYAHQDAMVILNDLEQAMKEPTND